MDKFLEREELPKLTKEKIGKLNLCNKRLNCNFRKLPTGEAKHLILHKHFQKTRLGENSARSVLRGQHCPGTQSRQGRRKKTADHASHASGCKNSHGNPSKQNLATHETNYIS